MIRTGFVSIVILLSLAGTVTSAAAQDAEQEPSLPTASPTAAATDPTLAGSITGTVRFTDGRPSPRRTVQIESADGTYRNSATTDAEGVYVFKGLADGRYYVGGFHPSRIPPEAVTSGEIVANPNTTQESVQALGAAPLVRVVDIVDGAAITGIDFTITDIGPEVVEGPEVDGRQIDGARPILPATGTSSPTDANSRVRWIAPSVLVLASLALTTSILRGFTRR